MKATELEKRVLDYIVADVQVSVARLGINATLSTEVTKNYRGEDLLEIISSPFQMMPVIFKEIRIDGTITVVKETDEGMEVYVRMDYAYTHFNGSTNGCELGRIHYAVEKNIPEKTTELRFYIRRLHGLEI